MVWPYDAKDVTYAPNSEVPSDNLNEIQDKVVDLFADHTIIECKVMHTASLLVTVDDGTIPIGGIYAYDSNPEYGYQYMAASVSGVWFQILARSSLVLKSLLIKWKNGHGGAASNTFTLYKPDMNFDASTTAPAIGASIKTASPAAASGAWESVAMASINETMGANDILLLYCQGMAGGDPSAGTGDFYAGVQATVQPLTAT